MRPPMTADNETPKADEAVELLSWFASWPDLSIDSHDDVWSVWNWRTDRCVSEGHPDRLSAIRAALEVLGDE